MPFNTTRLVPNETRNATDIPSFATPTDGGLQCHRHGALNANKAARQEEGSCVKWIGSRRGRPLQPAPQSRPPALRKGSGASTALEAPPEQPRSRRAVQSNCIYDGTHSAEIDLACSHLS